ncbi:MAG: nucleotide pyrophosphohydrolase [Planctomycetota bacterium]
MSDPAADSQSTNQAPHDSVSTVAELRDLVRRFVDERDWNQFHAPKNLTMALSIEAAELMEHFQWLGVEESRCVGERPEVMRDVEEELVDVLSYTLAIANALDIDLASTIHAKMEKNARKYPVEEFRGRYGSRDAGRGTAE